MLRIESKVRARALQLLYAWESGGSDQTISEVARKTVRLSDGSARELERAETLAREITGKKKELDEAISAASDNWRLERVGLIDRIILRVGLYELRFTETPAAVVIDEALRLSHWFGGAKTPSFVNGVLDALARSTGRL